MITLKIYDWMAGHRRLCLLSLLATTVLLALLVSRLSYKEDIRDFLPLDEEQQEAMASLEQQSQANRIVVIFDAEEEATLTQQVDAFVAAVEQLDTAHWAGNLTWQMDFTDMEQRQAELYAQMPLLLDSADYQRMDSLLRIPDYVATQLQQNREQLLLPTGSLLTDDIERDPLHLFSPVTTLLRDTSLTSRFDLYDGYLLTADHRRALVFLDSPFGASETASNARLISLLNTAADSTINHKPSTINYKPSARPKDACTARTINHNIHFIGGPVIAVTNASQIRTDSILSIALAVSLILLLLWLTIRRWRNILLIAVAIGWGWLFAMACLSLFHREVSVIVIGISSAIVGIAVNYPLHLISHLSHTPDVRQAIREIVKPLVVGNITTVGAFLTLVPLHSVALRDLGLFSAFLLIGTILFTILWMPHAVDRTPALTHKPSSFHNISSINYKPSARPKDACTARTINHNIHLFLLLLTLFFGCHSLNTSFDADLSHINYMTDEQRADMQWLTSLTSSSGTLRQQQLDRRFSTSPEQQQSRLRLWQSWTDAHRDSLLAVLRAESVRAGFAPGSFRPFTSLLNEGNSHPQSISSINYKPSTINHQPSTINHTPLLTSLTSNFNYIGIACGLIVFLFLWLSFRSLPLALLSFLPMAVSWVWILGIMSLCGLQFNIVNIILATFIFGQGDDYTIFMTEGAVYEYVHRRPMLASYKRAILLSALIMLIGIGSLIVARHPALHSLATVTIVGMFSVVLMAFVIPPLVFRWLVRYRRWFRF